MKILTASVLLVVLPGGVTLSTQYKADRSLRMEIDASLKQETTTLEMEQDGQPVQGIGGGMSSESTHKEIHVDKVVEAKDGKPTKVHRSFEKVGGKSSRSMGENSNETDIESPFDGVTLEIKRGADDKIEISALEGKAPDAKALENHLPENFLDGLLPEGEQKAEATWDLESAAIQRALRLDVRKALYPPPGRDEGGGGGPDGGGRRRGGRMGGGGDVLEIAEWKGKAKLLSTDKDVDGKTCAVVELKLTASGDLPGPETGGGRRGDRSFDLPFGALPGSMSGSILGAKNSYEVSLEGKLVFAIKERRPVSLELEGTTRTEVLRESTRNDHTMKFHTVLEGTVSYKVAVSEEAVKTEK